MTSSIHQRWQLVSARQFEAFAERWQRINETLGSSPLWHPDFVAPLLEQFGNGAEQLAIYGASSAPDAMAIVVRSAPFSWQTFQPAQAPVGMFLAKPGLDLETLSGALMASLPGMPVVLGITQQDPLVRARPADSKRLRTFDYVRTANVTVQESFDHYWAARGKNLRRNMKRDYVRLERRGITPRLELVTQAHEVAAAMADYARLETAGWKAQGGTAIATDNAQGRFYRDMLERFCRRGAGRIYRYWFNDDVVAMDLCIEEHGTIVMLKTTYDESIDTVAPGLLMREQEFRQIFAEQRTSRIEFFGRALDWQTRWTDEFRVMYHVNCYRWPWVRTLHGVRSATQAARTDGTQPDDHAAAPIAQ